MSAKKSVSKNAFLNIIKQLCAILFPMITFPYASRILGVEAYGKINFSASIISYISLIAALGITSYAIRECARVKDNQIELKKLADELFSINISTTLAAYVVLILLIFFWTKLRDYKALLVIQSLTVIATTVGTDWMNVVFEDYTYITIRYVACQIIAVLSMFALVKSSDDCLLYAAVGISSTVLANISNFFYIRKHLGINIAFTCHMNVKRHIRPLLILFGGAIASLIYINSDVTLLGIIKGDLEVGYYSVSAKIYTLVKQVMNAALVVLLPRVSNEIATDSREHLNLRFQKILDILIVLLGPACVGMFMLSSDIITLISGSEYLQAASSLRLLAVSLPFASLACFYINIVMIPYRMDKKVLFATAFSAAVNIILNVILIPKWGQNAAAFTTLLAEIMMLLCGIIFTRNLINCKLKKALGCAVLEMIGTTVICKVCCYWFTANLTQIISSVVLSCMLCAAAVVLVFGRKIFLKG